MIKTLKEFDFKDKRVLVRCDFNVPLDCRGKSAKKTSPSSLSARVATKGGEERMFFDSSHSEMKILDDFRIKETIPTIRYLADNGAKIILMSHLGRPEGKVVEELRLDPIQEKIQEYLNFPIAKAQDCVGSDVEKQIQRMKDGEVLLLENLRFHKEEEEGDLNFAKELAKLGDFYINDAFGACHRAHASIAGIPKYLPSGAGLLLEKEIRSLNRIIKNPQKPLISIIGGAKVETKAKLINKISEVSDWVLIGGLIKKELDDKKITLTFPWKIIAPFNNFEGKDIGPETIELFKEKISLAKTVFFNGVLGRIEEEEFAKGTEKILQIIIQSGAFSVVGGGEMVGLINKLGLINEFNHVSTGGGAMIAFLSGEKLPGIEALG